MAEEADEVAKAAAKKAKKQKARARKQQARLDAASADAILQSEQTSEVLGTLHLNGPAAGSAGEASPDQDTAGLQSQLQDKAAHSSIVHSSTPEDPVHVALEEPRSSSGGSLPAVGAASPPDISRGADATFLDQLLSCPITKVILSRRRPPISPSPHRQPLPPGHPSLFACSSCHILEPK